jgi:hypothetical protein
MKINPRAYVIKATAKQLGISENEVTLDTVLPHISDMARKISATKELKTLILIINLLTKYTVKTVIQLIT